MFLLVAVASGQTVTLLPTSLTFGNQVVGTTTALKNVTLSNTGTAALAITSIVASGSFSQTNTCGSSVSPNKKCTISVAFTPTATGAATGSVTISDNAGNSPQKVTLSGTGIMAATLAPAVVSFASRTLGTTSSPVAVALTNNETATLTIYGVTVSGDYAQTNTCGTTLAAKAKCTISVTFTPTEIGTRTGTLTVTDSGSNSPQTSSLQGTGSLAGLTSIAVTPANPSVAIGAAQQFTATGTFSGSTTYNITQSVTWGSTKTSVASVSNAAGMQGLASALASGASTIKASSGKIVGSTLLTVTSAPTLVSIAVTPAAPSIALGSQQQFAATGTYSNGSTQNLTSSAMWSSSATKVATIASGGLAASVAVGTSTINATYGSITGSTLLTVSAASLVSIAVTPARPSFALSTIQQLVATGTYTDGSTLVLTNSVAWSSVSASIATVNSQGIATAVAQGTSNLTAAVGTISGSTVVTVTPAVLVSMVVTPAIPALPIGVAQQFVATGTFSDGSTQNITALARWSSSASAIATVGSSAGSAGLASTEASGTTTITAASGSISGSTTLTVTTATLLSIAITPATPSIALGAAQQFAASGTYTDGSTQNLTSTASWSSSTPSTATINTSGLAQSLEVGSTNIAATFGTISSSTQLTVTGATLVSIAISPTSGSIAPGTTQQFTATGTYTDGSTQVLTQSSHWSSTVASVATISDTAGTSGLAAASGAGTTTIGVTSGSLSTTATLVVNPVTLVSIAINPTAPIISLGATQQFSATGTFSDGSTQNLTSAALWNSSNANVAVMGNAASSYGLATSAEAGAATITAADGSISSSTTLTVSASQPALVSIALTPLSFQIVIGATQQLAAIGTYSDGSTQNLTSTAIWTSSSPSTASVTAGTVTAQANGLASISASMNGINSPLSNADVGTAADFYIATDGNDSWAGTLWDPNSTNSNGPFATIARAQIAVQAILSNPKGRTMPITVLIRAGNYYQQALTFTAADSGTATLGVNWQNYPNETPVLSGGMMVSGWTSLGSGLYQATLPTNTVYFENLFYNGGRRLRPRVGAGDVGAYKRIAGTVYLSGSPPPASPPATYCNQYVSGSGWECFDRFSFSPGDISSAWTNLNSSYPTGDIEVVAFEWWSVPKLRVQSVDSVNNIVYFTGPTAQVAEQHGFIPNHRYIVENVKNLLTQGGQWFLDRSATPWTLSYVANPGEDPPTDLIVVPQSTQVWTGTNLSYVTFTGLTFEHDNFTVPSAGYVSSQQEPNLPGALTCYNCQYVTFNADIITMTAGSGIEFKTSNTSMTTAYNSFENGALYDIGGDGIRVGMPPLKTDTDANVPQFSTIQNNLIEGYARVFPSGIGIVQGSGHNNTYTHNDIYDGYHSGIEVCLPPSCAPGTNNSTGSFSNVASFNHVFDLFEGVTDDGGAIYFATGGQSYVPSGNQVVNNKIHDTSSAAIIDSDGYGGDAINLDSSTGLVIVENNLVYRLSGVGINQTYGPQLPNLANTIQNNILAYARNGMISNGNPYPTNVCPAFPVVVFNATNNLFYFDRLEGQNFYIQQGCDYSCGFPLTDLHNWQSNLYWRINGTFSTDALAFHNQPAAGTPTLCGSTSKRTYYPFTGWKGLGEDTASLDTVNPGFENPAYPNDDYSLPNGSPGIGFVVFDPSQAGRSTPVIKPTDPIDIPATFPTATYNPATDY